MTWNILYATFTYQAPTVHDPGPKEEPDMGPLSGSFQANGDHKPYKHQKGYEKPSCVRGPGRDVCS